MNELERLLDDFSAGKLNKQQVMAAVRRVMFVDVGPAKLDMSREMRCGCPEVVFCQSKTPDQVRTIMLALAERNGRALGTRAAPEHFEPLKNEPGAHYDPVSRLITINAKDLPAEGRVMVVSGGTADLPIAEEAARTAEFLGSRVVRHFDCGVAGVHRLLSVADDLVRARAVVAVAGMDGALPQVTAGLVSGPVIAVPTSVGYGTGLGGVAALLTMLNSCSPNVCVVNIDNGFGGGYLAHVVNSQSRTEE